MAIEKVRNYLRQFGLDNNILEFSVSSATVKEAALALNCEEKEIAKSMGFLVNNEAILVVTAGDQKIDNSKYKAKFGVKAKMIAFMDLERIIGYAAGGVCPFGINEGVKVYLDVSLKRFEYVYPACGSHNSAIKLTLEQLKDTSKFIEWVDVCKYIEND